MIYEQAQERLGEAPAWVLKGILERQPKGSKDAQAAMLLLKARPFVHK